MYNLQTNEREFNPKLTRNEPRFILIFTSQGCTCVILPVQNGEFRTRATKSDLFLVVAHQKSVGIPGKSVNIAC